MEEKLTAMIIDAESAARQELTTLLADFPQIEIIAEASNGKDALISIEKQQPDILFLAVDMPAMNGFELFAKLKKQPKVFFITEAGNPAIAIFQQKNIDYLLKPFQKKALATQIAKLSVTHKALALPLQNLLSKLNLKTSD